MDNEVEIEVRDQVLRLTLSDLFSFAAIFVLFVAIDKLWLWTVIFAAWWVVNFFAIRWIKG